MKNYSDWESKRMYKCYTTHTEEDRFKLKEHLFEDKEMMNLFMEACKAANIPCNANKWIWNTLIEP